MSVPRARLAPLATAGPLLALWLIWMPRSPDLAAQVYRVGLFARNGYALWDNGWYAGHYVPDYSLTFPPLAALLGLPLVGLLAVCGSTAIFGRLARAHLRVRPNLATSLFAVGAAGDLFIGRVTFALGATCALAAVLACTTGHRRLAALAGLLCAATSPVAGLFLALAGAAGFVSRRRARDAIALAVPPIVVIAVVAALFPEGGWEPFSGGSFAVTLGIALAVLAVLPAEERTLRAGAALYALAVIASFLVPTPMGSNVDRLGVLLAAPVLVGVVTDRDIPAVRRRLGRALPAGAALTVLAAAAVCWQVAGPASQSLQGRDDPSLHRAYYRPVVAFLTARSGGAPLRVEDAFTRSHWDAIALGRRFSLARGWERQLDTRYDALFYAPRLTAAAYQRWLEQTAVRYVAVSDAPLDDSSVQEAALIARHPAFLRLVFRSAHWRVYAVVRPQPLASPGARVTALTADTFTLHADAPGNFEVRVRFTPYWALQRGTGCVSQTADGWTRVTLDRAGTAHVAARFAPLRTLTGEAACRPLA
jgi:hypothetical protein